jgi:hypothetical protein
MRDDGVAETLIGEVSEHRHLHRGHDLARLGADHREAENAIPYFRFGASIDAEIEAGPWPCQKLHGGGRYIRIERRPASPGLLREVKLRMSGQRLNASRLLLAAFTIWALAMILPELDRLFRPLGSFGFYANNDGLVTDVRGRFPDEAASPAFQAGLRVGDRLDLSQMRCFPPNTHKCASALAALGGMRLVSPQRRVELALAATQERPARKLEFMAKQAPFSWGGLAVLLLDQTAAILVILAAAWLVWTRPGGMTWGFFLYVIWFNPGQSFKYYALLQHYPAALLMQSIAGAIAKAAGFAGFILFAIRAPTNEKSARWRGVEKTLPIIAILLATLLSLSYANLFGSPTETVTRAGILCGLLVAACAFFILLLRRRVLPPQDYQRLRWVIWGCLIGLPALTIADAGDGTTLLDALWAGHPPPDEVWGLLRLINGVLCLFVFEALRRPRVVSVGIPLRRVTILGLLLSMPALLLHEQIEHMRDVISESIDLPGWLWIAAAAAMFFLISRVHELAVHLTDRYFNRGVARAGERLGDAILHAQNFTELEGHLVHGARTALGLASACIFREAGGVFVRSAEDKGWDESAARTLDPRDPMLEPAKARRPFDVDAKSAARNRLPSGLMQPIVAVPVGDRIRCLAIALYGPHNTGNDLNHDERVMLAELAEKAACAFLKLDHDQLCRRIAELEHELETIATRLAGSASAVKSTETKP